MGMQTLQNPFYELFVGIVNNSRKLEGAPRDVVIQMLQWFQMYQGHVSSSQPFASWESVFGGAGRTTGGSDTTHACAKLLDMNVLRCTALRCAAQDPEPAPGSRAGAGFPSRRRDPDPAPGSRPGAGIPSRRRDPEPGQARAESANSEQLFLAQITAGRPRDKSRKKCSTRRPAHVSGL